MLYEMAHDDETTEDTCPVCRRSCTCGYEEMRAEEHADAAELGMTRDEMVQATVSRWELRTPEQKRADREAGEAYDRWLATQPLPF